MRSFIAPPPSPAASIGARIASAAAYPVATLMPVPDFSFQGAAPPMIAPAAWRFAYTGVPWRSTGRSSASIATPAVAAVARRNTRGEPHTVRVRDAVHRQLEDRLARTPNESSSRPPLANPPVASTTDRDGIRDRARWRWRRHSDSMRPPRRARADGPARPARRAPAGAQDAASGRRTGGCPGTDGGSVAISNTVRPSRSSSACQISSRPAQPEHRRDADALVGLDSTVERADQPVGEVLSVEPPGQDPAAEVAPAARPAVPARARAPRSATGRRARSEVAARSARVEVLEALEADEDQAAAGAQVAAGHGPRHQRRGLATPSAVGSSRFASRLAGVAQCSRRARRTSQRGRELLGADVPRRDARARVATVPPAPRPGCPPASSPR